MEKFNKKLLISFGIIIIVAIAAWSFSCSSSEVCGASKTSEQTTSSEQVEQSYQTGFKGLVSPSDFSDLIETEDYIILDIRTQSEYDDVHITESPMLIDYYKADFKDNLSKLDKTKTYLIYCNSGNRSSSATVIMKDLGFESFYELKGGITAWKSSGLEVY